MEPRKQKRNGQTRQKSKKLKTNKQRSTTTTRERKGYNENGIGNGSRDGSIRQNMERNETIEQSTVKEEEVHTNEKGRVLSGAES